MALQAASALSPEVRYPLLKINKYQTFQIQIFNHASCRLMPAGGELEMSQVMGKGFVLEPISPPEVRPIPQLDWRQLLVQFAAKH